MDQITDWLLDGPAWIKYAARTQLLNEAGDAAAALADEAVQNIVTRLKDKRRGIGAWRSGTVSCEVQGSAVWDLFLLTDIGFNAAQLGIQAEAEAILGSQRPDGAFITEPGMEDNYFCLSGVLLACLARSGYAKAPEMTRFVRRLLVEQRPGGGWNCEDSRTDCPMDNLNVLMLLSEYPKYTWDNRLNGALELLLGHWAKREHGLRLAGFGIGRRYRSLQYPAIKYGILRVLDVASKFPHAVAQPAFQDMLDFVRSRGRDGYYHAEMPPESYRGFDFAQTETPSRWITFLVRRIEQRTAGVTETG
jgi:hypothetical protein